MQWTHDKQKGELRGRTQGEEAEFHTRRRKQIVVLN